MTLNELEAEIAKIKKENSYAGEMEVGPVFYNDETLSMVYIDKLSIIKIKDANDFVGIHWTC